MTYEENILHKKLIATKAAALEHAKGDAAVVDAIIGLIDAKIAYAKAELREAIISCRDGGGMP